MITKTPRDNKGLYDLIITDKNGKSFMATVAGTGDLFWMPERYKENTTFVIDKGDEIAFSVFSQLFDAVEKNDNEYNPVLKDNTINFISEDWHEDEANRLKITKTEDEFIIDFIENKNKEAWSFPHRGANICFCNSGSRVPRVESLFMRMFLHLAYHCDLIQVVEEEQNNKINTKPINEGEFYE